MSANFDRDLERAYTKLLYDPLAFVHFNYPWKKAGTMLEGENAGPDEWQITFFQRLQKEMLERKEGKRKDAIRMAVGSGHGIGKGCMATWLVDFFMSTRPKANIVVTANTRDQLQQKTWREVSKWHQVGKNRHWFKHTATSHYHVANEFGWRANALPWSSDRSEAFAGTHEEASCVVIIFDESSRIEDIMWEVSEGAMTTTECYWFAFGNRTQATGQFNECFGDDSYRNGGRWIDLTVDSRLAKMTNKDEIEGYIKKYGEESDFFRVRVAGLPPKVSSTSLFTEHMCSEAKARHYDDTVFSREPRIMGVDVSEGGDDLSVIYRRQGLASFPIKTFSTRPERFADMVLAEIESWRPDAIFLDESGAGQVVRYIVESRGYSDILHCVRGSFSPFDTSMFYNLRTEMYFMCRDWMENGGAIPDDRDLIKDLCAHEKSLDNKRDVYQLERKEDVKKRIGRSPDRGDALALTFAGPIAPVRADDMLQRLKREREARDYDETCYFNKKVA